MNAQELGLDYFAIYDVLRDPKANVDVELKGQFDRKRQPMHLNLLDYFGNCASKNREPLYNRSAHLAWYAGISRKEPARRVQVANQFGRYTIVTKQSVGLLVPTTLIPSDVEQAKKLDHYKVYVLDHMPSLDITVQIRDEFGSRRVTVLSPRYFAVPVVKWHKETGVELANQRAHLLIYQITPKAADQRIAYKNQFETRKDVVLTQQLMLAVPCSKDPNWKAI